jgi:hypothetical protein
MITVHLQGGLGNQLFQLGFLEYIHYKSGRQMYISDLKSPKTVHSSEQYFETIFQEWKKIYQHTAASYIHEHPKMIHQEWEIYPGNTCYVGYFQDYKYLEPIKASFIQKLSFNTRILDKYPLIHTKTFIHIRGGDYLTTSFHNVCDKEYYEKAMKYFNTEFVIFTNDISYSKQLFPNIPVIQESEVDSLYLMSQCSGCICANSSFSWWGAYLNSDRQVTIPSTWVNDKFHHETYRVPGWVVI